MDWKIILWVPPVLLAAASLILFLVMAKKGKGVYDSYTEDLDKKEWSMKDSLYIGFAWCAAGIDDKCMKPISEIWNRYKHNVYSKILLLYGKRFLFIYTYTNSVLSFLIKKQYNTALCSFITGPAQSDISFHISLHKIHIRKRPPALFPDFPDHILIFIV